MKLTDFKIGRRLAGAFALLLLLSVGSAGLALLELAAIENNLEDIVTDNNVKIRLIHAMAESVHVGSRVMRTVVLLHEKPAIEAEERTLKNALQTYDAAWAALQKLPSSATGAGHHRMIAAAADAERPMNSQLMELAYAGKDNEAVSFLIQQVGPASQTWQKALDENISYEEANSQKQYVAAMADYRQARDLLIAANLLCVGWRRRWHGVSPGRSRCR